MAAPPLTPPSCRLEQEKMKKDIGALQRLLETKERRMQDLVRNTTQVGVRRRRTVCAIPHRWV